MNTQMTRYTSALAVSALLLLSACGGGQDNQAQATGVGAASAASNQPTAQVVEQAATPTEYQANRQKRMEFMVQGTKQGNVIAAFDTVFTSKYCEKIDKAAQEANKCTEIQAVRSRALTVLQDAATKGDTQAAFALARAMVLDNTEDSKLKAIALLEATPEKSKEMTAFLEYLQRPSNASTLGSASTDAVMGKKSMNASKTKQ